jgi:hypothetical protein
MRRTDSQLVLGPSDDILGAGTSDETTSEKQDFLSRLFVERKEFPTKCGLDIPVLVQ